MSKTTKKVHIGLLDSGMRNALSNYVRADAAFECGENGALLQTSDADDFIGHGTRIANVILMTAPYSRFFNARIFSKYGVTRPVIVAAALDWVIARGAQIVNMSFGLHADRVVLRQSCERALATGAILLAASPARGKRIYPAAYDGVIRVTGDARCAPGEISALFNYQADFGAYAWPLGVTKKGIPIVGGASYSVASVTASVAALFHKSPTPGYSDVIQYLQSLCNYHGEEHRNQ